MKSMDDKRDNAPARYPMTPCKTSKTRNRSHLVEPLAKEVPWSPQTSPAIAKSVDYSLQPKGMALLLKTIRYVLEPKECELVSN